jgi:hypothetical protein
VRAWLRPNLGGARFSDILKMVGPDPAARYVEISCLDDYYSSYDIESCLHPQTLLCWEMYGEPLGRPGLFLVQRNLRKRHFGAMIGFLSFVPGHLLMVALHGWSSFYSMLTGWKRDPDYLTRG